MAFDAEVWNVVSKKSTKRGVWMHLRHLGSMESVWFSSAHFCPGVTHGQYEQEVEDHFRSMPRVAKMVIFQGDLNSSFRWHRVDERVDAIGKDGKSDIFARYATEAGLDFVPFGPSQWNTPTSRPRQAHRIGTQIDYMLCKGVRRDDCNIYVDSCHCTGSDHECIGAGFYLKTTRENHRSDTRPRVWTGLKQTIVEMNQQVVEELARNNTKPRQGASFQDSPEIKQAFKQANISKTAGAWDKGIEYAQTGQKEVGNGEAKASK